MNKKVDNAIAQRHHIFIDDFELTPVNCPDELSINSTLHKAVNKRNDKKYLLLKANAPFPADEPKYLFIRHAEKATELCHPAIFNLSGFSDKAPDLYFDYYPGLDSPITDEQLRDLDFTDFQIITLGTISGLSYIISNGYSIYNFSINSIFYSKQSGPKFVNYINMFAIEMNYALNQLVEKSDERVLVYQVGQIMRELLNRTKKADKGQQLDIPNGINPTLKQYILSCNNDEDRPTLKELFNSLSVLFKDDSEVKKYLKKLDSADKYRFDYRMDQEDYVPFKILKDDYGTYFANKFFDNSVNILHSCYIQDDVFRHKEYFPLLNRLPDSDIKLLLQSQKNPPKLFYEFLCYEREYLLLPEYHDLFFSEKPETNFFIYQKLMEKSKSEENPNQAIYPIALKHLKFAAKKNHKDAKIQLAIHYLKGDIVPANVEKALMFLKSVSFGNEEDVSRYINPIEAKMKVINIQVDSLKPEQQAAIKKAEEGQPLYMLYVAFAYYSGIEHFPVSPSRAVHYYREAALKSPHFMCLLGGMYLQGYIFPRNIIRARHCFEKAALDGSIKAQIIDSLIRKHIWRFYLSDVSIQTMYNKYAQCPESISFDDTLIFPEVNFLIQNTQNQLLHTSPYMSSFYFYDRRNVYEAPKKSEMKLAMKTVEFRVPTLTDDGMNNDDIKILQFYSYLNVVNTLLGGNILPQKLTPAFHERRSNFIVSFAKDFINEKFGFMFSNDDDEDEAITTQNMVKYEITADMEDNLDCMIQNKYIPMDVKEGQVNCSRVSYIPRLSLPIADIHLRELKSVVDHSFEEVMDRVLKNDAEHYLPTHINVPSKSIEDYFENQELVLKTTIKEHMPGNKLCHDFVSTIDSFEVYYSEPVFYSAQTARVKDDIKTHMKLAQSFFFGQNGFPVNYTEAAKHYQKAADKGNAEAQWKFATLQVIGLGTKQDGKSAFTFMKRSAEQQDPDGMLRYGLFIRHYLINHGTKENVELPSYQRYLEQSAATGNLEAINQLGMILESNYCFKQGTEKAITKYEEAVNQGLLDTIFRIIPIYDNSEHEKEYNELIKLAVGMCDHDITVRLIQLNNHRKRYEQSEKLIKVGLCFDKDAFLPNYAKHIVLYSGSANLRDRIAYAKSLITPTLNNPSQSIIEHGYLETYLMAMLTILSKANEYEEACQLFIKNMNCLTTKSKKEFINFYMHINKKVARKYQLSINSYLPEYRACVDAFLLIKQKGINVKHGDEKLKQILQENSSNQFALLKRGKILLKNHLFMRRNISKALELIQKAAKQNCPEARFGYGKELYYGQTIPMNRFKAFKYFKKAFDESNQDPRAGYFLSKKCYVKRNLIKQEEADECLKTACRSGYRRALFKLGKRFYYGKGNKSALGIILLKKAREQQYPKAIDFLNNYENGLSEETIIENEQKAYFAFAKELYYGRIIAQDIQMSFRLFMKFLKNKDPDYRAGYFLSKKRYIQMELITPRAARNALVISAKHNYKCALYRLGKLYYMREGKRDKGILLMKKAKKQNYQKAIDFLKDVATNQIRMNLKLTVDSSTYFPRKQSSQTMNVVTKKQKFKLDEDSKSVLGDDASTLEEDETESESINYLIKKNIDNNAILEKRDRLDDIPISIHNQIINENNNNQKKKNNNNNNDNNNNNNNNNNDNNNNNNNADVENENIVPDEININIPFHKSGTTSNIQPQRNFDIPIKLAHTSSKLTKTNDINEPLLSDFNQDNNNNNDDEKENPEKQTRINLNDPVTSDFSDEPDDE